MYLLNEDQRLFVDQVRRMVSEKVAPRAEEIDKKGEFPWDLALESKSDGSPRKRVLVTLKKEIG